MVQTNTAEPSKTDRWLTPEVFEIPVPGNGTVRAYTCGPEDAPVVVGIHGTYGTGVEELVKYVGNSNVFCRLVALDRPGYAGSADVTEPKISDFAPVLAAILDHLDISVAGVYGHSGGGPRALAAAALLPDRVSRVATVGGVGPSLGPGFDYLDGLTRSSREEFVAARQGHEVFRKFVTAQLEQSTDDDVVDDDLYIDNDAHVAEVFRPPVQEWLRKHVQVEFEGQWWLEGYINDCVALASDWGFNLGAIRVPTRLFHGAADLAAPIGHSEWLATQIPGAEVEGFLHMGHRLDQLMPHIFSWLVQDLR